VAAEINTPPLLFGTVANQQFQTGENLEESDYILTQKKGTQGVTKTTHSSPVSSLTAKITARKYFPFRIVLLVHFQSLVNELHKKLVT